jgi:hypothetical protein
LSSVRFIRNLLHLKEQSWLILPPLHAIGKGRIVSLSTAS